MESIESDCDASNFGRRVCFAELTDPEGMFSVAHRPCLQAPPAYG